MRRLRYLLGSLGLLALLMAWPSLGRAASVIRDTEIEVMIREIADPIFAAADLQPGEIDIYLVNDSALNAFVAGGQNMFVNSGLLLRTRTPEQLAGVIAHETGHIAGGHLTRLSKARESAGTEALIGALLGAAAAVAGAPQLGTAIIAGGLTVAQSGILTFSRTQEQSADQAAIGFLATLHLPPEGLLEFFEVLENQNLRITTDGNVYMRTHPLTRDRITFLENQQAISTYPNGKLDTAIHVAHARSKAKLDGFLGEPTQMIAKYSGDDVVSRYARSMALHRLPDLEGAVALIDQLIAEYPKDPYFHELKGQILFESGRVKESIEPYRQAMRAMPSAALIRLGLGRALVEQSGAPALKEAATVLEEAVRLEPRNAMAWRTLGIAQGKLGEQGPSAMSLAESAVLVGRKQDAELYVRRAQQFVNAQDPAWYRLQDLVRQVAELPEPRQPRRR